MKTHCPFVLKNGDPYNYFPISDGLPYPKMGLKKLPFYKNNLQKNNTFQIDENWETYREVKDFGRKENLKKYYQNIRPDNPHINKHIIETLCQEYPEHFQWEEATGSLNCQLSQEKLHFKSYVLDLKQKHKFNYLDGFDALAHQISEDLVTHEYVETQSDQATRIHLSHPNGWSAQEQIGRFFMAIHEKVPNINTIIAKPNKVLDAIMKSTQKFERVAALNFRTTNLLNRHPSLDPSIRHTAFHHEKHPQLYLRFERQTVFPIAKTSEFLFTIKTYIIDIKEILLNKNEQSSLVQDILLNEDGDKKGFRFISQYKEELKNWLELLN